MGATCTYIFILYIYYQRLGVLKGQMSVSRHTLGLGLGHQSWDLRVLVLNVIFLALVLNPSVITNHCQ